MTIKEEITIAAEPADIWPFIALPEGMALWNPKLTAVERQTKGPVCVGERFGVSFTMSGKTRHAIVEVLECELSSRLTLKYHAQAFAPTMRVTIALTPFGSVTHVRQTITLPLPWFIAPIFWLIQKFGKPVEECHLVKLQRLVEQTVATPPAPSSR